MEQYAVMVVLGLVSETIKIPNKSLTWILFFIGLFVEIPPFVFFFDDPWAVSWPDGEAVFV